MADNYISQDKLVKAIGGFCRIAHSQAADIDSLRSAVSEITKHLDLIKFDIEELRKGEKKKPTFIYQSISELEEGMMKLPVGRHSVSVKGLDIFTLYVGDEYIIVLYPDFVDIDKPFVQAGNLRMSKWSPRLDKWI